MITFGWKWNQIEITLFSYSKNTIYKNYYFDYIPELHKHLLYKKETMKEKRRVFSEQIDYIINYPIKHINNDYDFDYEKNITLKRLYFSSYYSLPYLYFLYTLYMV